MFKELNDKINYLKTEKLLLEKWDSQNIFEKSISSKKDKPLFIFYEGPPTSNGRPGIHHVMARTLKDAICRYKTMRGFQVPRKAGWDTHGLPVEIEVEKSLGIKHKDEILDFGVEKFNIECKKSVWKYKTEWEQMTRDMGYWVDMKTPYITFENNYIESVWWALSEFFKKEMIYKGFKIQPYCPRCETPLSSHEISLGYQNVTDNSLYIKFKLVDEENSFILSWTTTPWTLPGNVALAVGNEIQYVKLKVGEEFWIIAKDLIDSLGEVYPIVENYLGKDLVGRKYYPLFEVAPLKSETSYKIYSADFVTTTDGTGVVHTAVMYGEDDYQLGKQVGLPQHHTVDKSGNFTNDVKDFGGLFVKDKATEKKIVAHLKSNNNFVKLLPYAHEYPHCWRCTSPLLYYARNSWYISTTKYADKMVENNKKVNWFPQEVGTGRFGNWLEENKDWALSRDRYWGTPLPIWICEKCNATKCVGSVEEFKKGKNISEPLDLHKPFVDAVTFDCTCGGTMFRTPELIDAWFDSGSMPFAQHHYPFENKELFEKSFPADFISEGIDQTRGWFYTLHSIGTFLFNQPTFKNVLVNELILDKKGQKMSKSKGNTVNPFDVMEKYGADSTRWYLMSNSPVWKPTLFDENGIAEVQRKFFNTLLNTYSFFALYANIDGFTYSEEKIPVIERSEIDKWILSELNSMIKRYLESMEKYDLTRATREISDFTLDYLSNWYVRRNRRRFWKSEKGKDKTAAYQTLYECLIAVTKLTAPIAPFLVDDIFYNLNSNSKKENVDSVHLSEIENPDLNLIDEQLEIKMEQAIRVVGIVRAIRMKSNLKVRQPLKKILIPVIDKKDEEIFLSMKDVILEEINVKELELISGDSSIVNKKAKPNFRVLGQKYGKEVQQVASIIKNLNSTEITLLQKNGSASFNINSQSYIITNEDFEIHFDDVQGWLVESDGKVTVALDTEITEELKKEGLAREFVNRIQNMRKDAGFEVTDRIKISVSSSEEFLHSILAKKEYITKETLAVDLNLGEPNGDFKSSEEIENYKCEIVISKAN
ncbi:MAG: isoleucine--tRNA ligase [Bacteroidota bacterium]